MSLVENWKHVGVRGPHLNHIFIHASLVIDLLRRSVKLRVLNLEVVKLELLLLLLIETHLLSWCLPVSLSHRHHLV